jgi:hypothetical protein
MTGLRVLIPLLACAVAAQAAEDGDALKRRVAELERENTELKRASVTYRALSQAGLHIWMDGAGAFDADAPSAAICQLLALDDDARKAVAKAFAHAKQSLGEALRRLGLRPTVSGGSLTLAIEDFSAAGGQVERTLDDELAAAIGADRRDFLKILADSAIEKSLLQFGKGHLDFTVKPAGDGRCEYQFAWKSSRGSNSFSSTSDGLPHEAALLAPYIPKAFGGQRADEGDGAPAADAQHGGKSDF